MSKKSVIEQNLTFPDAPDFMKEEIVFTATEMVAMCEPLLPYWNKKRYTSPEPPFIGEAFSLKKSEKGRPRQG
jgi:hypothetical protein